MKTGGCPKCESKELYEIEQMLIPDYRTSNSYNPFTLAVGYGMYGKQMANARISVPARAYVCAKCSYTEIYANDMDVLARLESAGTHQIKKVKR